METDGRGGRKQRGVYIQLRKKKKRVRERKMWGGVRLFMVLIDLDGADVKVFQVSPAGQWCEAAIRLPGRKWLPKVVMLKKILSPDMCEDPFISSALLLLWGMRGGEL